LTAATQTQATQTRTLQPPSECLRGFRDRAIGLIAKVASLRASVGNLDRRGRLSQATTLIQEFEADLAKEGDETTPLFVDPTTDPVTDAAGLGLPLVITGPGGDYRREICGDPRTGQLLDIRA
jgi:hypothetical protein